MNDFLSACEAAARDPLVVMLGLFVLGGLATFLFFKRHPIGRAVVRVITLIVLTVALVRADVVPYQPLELTGSPFRDAGFLSRLSVWRSGIWRAPNRCCTTYAL